MNYTCVAIKNTFMELLKEKPLDKISVKEITKKCQINRNTFYYHYHDTYDLLQKIFEEEAEKYATPYLDNDMEWKDCFIQAVGFALENKEAICHVFNSMQRSTLEKYLFDVSGSLMASIIKKKSEGLDISAIDKKYMTIVYKHAIVGIIIEWLGNDMQDDPYTVIDRMSKIFNGSIEFILQRLHDTKE